jgi:hypothetical protein
MKNTFLQGGAVQVRNRGRASVRTLCLLFFFKDNLQRDATRTGVCSGRGLGFHRKQTRRSKGGARVFFLPFSLAIPVATWATSRQRRPLTHWAGRTGKPPTVARRTLLNPQRRTPLPPGGNRGERGGDQGDQQQGGGKAHGLCTLNVCLQKKRVRRGGRDRSEVGDGGSGQRSRWRDRPGKIAATKVWAVCKFFKTVHFAMATLQRTLSRARGLEAETGRRSRRGGARIRPAMPARRGSNL